MLYNEVMKVLTIINPNSGTWNSKLHIIDVLSVFSKHGYTVETYITQASGDAYNHLKNIKDKYDIVCAFGGDGTANEVINGLMSLEVKPLFAYFPSGTINDFGSNFNLDGNWKDIAERICEGNSKEFDLGKFEDRYFDYVAAFGAMCDVPYTTNRKTKEALGSIAYFLEGITKLPEIKPIKVKVSVNGKTEKITALFGLIFHGGRVAGMEWLPKDKSSVNDGEFNIMIVDYVELPILQQPDIITTLAFQNKHIHWYKASEITLEFEEEVKWTIDGEKAQAQNKITIENIHSALKILC